MVMVRQGKLEAPVDRGIYEARDTSSFANQVLRDLIPFSPPRQQLATHLHQLSARLPSSVRTLLLTAHQHSHFKDILRLL
jgi:hypothetical protein